MISQPNISCICPLLHSNISCTLSREWITIFFIFSAITSSQTSYPYSPYRQSFNSSSDHMLPGMLCILFTVFACLATLLLARWEYLLVILLKLKSAAGNLTQFSAYSQMVSGFQSVTITHYLISNFLFFIMSVFSIYF